jgi:hypothetical protein
MKFSCAQNPWNNVLLQKLTVAHIVGKFQVFYGTKRFITSPKEPATGSCSTPDESNPRLPILFL